MPRPNPKTRTIPAAVLMLIATLALSGCGGGGGAGDDEDAAAAVDNAAVTPAKTVAGADTVTADGDVGEWTGDTSDDVVPDPSAGVGAARQPVVSASATTSTLVVRASGVLVDNVGSMLRIYVGGQVVATAELRTTALQDLIYTVPAAVSGTRVDIAYTNDATINGVDRNARVASITVDGTTLEASSASYDVGSGNAAFDGVDVRPGQANMFWNGALRFVVGGSGTVPAALPAGSGFYVDATNGNDANAGNSSSAPWKSLSKLAGVRLSAGQGMYLRCGQTWREQLVLTNSQLVGGSIVAGYGSECATSKAVVSGAVALNGGWTRSGNVWSRSVPAGTPQIARLTVGSQVYRVAQWPNYAGAATEYDTTAAGSPSSRSTMLLSSAGRAAVGSNPLVGATVSLRSLPWQAENVTVSSYSSADGRIGFATSTANTLQPGIGYILSNRPWMLDTAGEFFHDTASNTIRVIGATPEQQSNLNAFAVDGAVRSTVVRITGRPDLVVRDIEATMSTADGLVINDAPGFRLERVRATRNGRSGISTAIFDPAITSTARSTIANGYVDANWQFGIDGRHLARLDVLDTVVKDTGMAGNTANSIAGIAVGSGGTVQRSTVTNSAQAGVLFSGTGGTVVRGNRIESYCVRFADCGAVYTWNGPKASRRTTDQSWTVEDNRIVDGKANYNGAPGEHVVAGVYLDDYTMGGTVRDNVVTTSPIGIFLHNVSSTAVTGNKVWLTTRSGLTAAMDQTDYDYMTGNTISGNEFVRTTSTSGTYPAQPVTKQTSFVEITHSIVGTGTLTSGSNLFSANRYLELNGSAGNFARLKDSSGERFVDSAGWRALATADSPVTMPLTFVLSDYALGPNLLSGGDFSGSMSPWSTYFTSSTPRGSARWVSAMNGCTGGCVELTSAKLGDMLSSPPFSLTGGTLYQYRYTAVYNANGTVGEPYIARTVSPWDSMIDAKGHKANVSRTGVVGRVSNFEAFFTAKTSATAQVNLQIATAYAPIAFDNVSLRAVLGYRFAEASQWQQLVWAGAGATTVSCASLGWDSGCSVTDHNGTPVALPVTVAAGESRLFLRLDSEWKR